MAGLQKLYLSGQFSAVGPANTRWVLSAFFWSMSLAQLGMFIAQLVCSSWQLAPLEANPLIGANKDVLTRLGATATYKITDDKQWWRLISSPFLPAGTLHLWANTSAMWTFGLFLAHALSPWQLILVYSTSALAGVTVSANVASDYITSAASGPVFGLIGGTCMALLMYWRLFRRHIMSWTVLAFVLALNLFIGATPFVDQSCNLAGFVAGSLCTSSMLLLNKQGVTTRVRELRVQLLMGVLLGLTLAISVLAIIGLNTSDPPLAGCCNNLVCTSSPLWDCDASKVYLDCSYNLFQNGTVIITCPKGSVGQVAVSAATADSTMRAMCSSMCGLRP